MVDATIPTRAYCNCIAQEQGLDPIGHGGHFDDAIVIETPLPWKPDLMQKAGALPQAMIDVMGVWLQDYYAGKGYPHLPMVIAPDPEYSREGYRRVMLYTKPNGMFARFEKVEYLAPVDEVGALVWALYQDRDALSRFEPYRVNDADSVRDILVCTHGSVDVVCGKFGYPVFKHMRATYADQNVRVWRVSHFGGHVFAPTIMDMPSGHYWAYVKQPQAAPIIERSGEVESLRGHYRGWAGVTSGFMQTAEAHLWQQHGWQWFDYEKTGTIIAQDTGDSPTWADVRIEFRAPKAEYIESVTMRVEITGTIHTPHSTGESKPYPYPQYRVVDAATSVT